MHVLISNIQIFKHYSLLIVLTVLTQKTPSWLWSLTGRKQGHVVSEVQEYHSHSAWAFWILLIHQQRTSQVLRVRQIEKLRLRPNISQSTTPSFDSYDECSTKIQTQHESKLGCSMEHVRVHHVSPGFTCTSSHSSHDIAPNMLQGWTKVVP